MADIPLVRAMGGSKEARNGLVDLDLDSDSDSDVDSLKLEGLGV